jgi:hypothetical protein
MGDLMHDWRYWSRDSSSAAIGPRGDVVVEQYGLNEIATKLRDPGTSQRRARAWERWLIYTENFKSLVQEKINRVQESEDIRARLSKHITLAINLGLDITRDVSVVWRHGTRRNVTDDGVWSSAPDAFADLVSESRFSSYAPIWNQLAFFLGPVTVVPVVRGEPGRRRMTWDTILPHQSEVVVDPNDPFGLPKAIVWDVSHKAQTSWYNTATETKVDVMMVDDQAWYYFRNSGNNLEEVLPPQPHDVGRFPGSVLRFDVPLDLSWWGIDPNRRLVDATVDIAYLLSALSLVRKGQRSKKLAVAGDLGAMPRGQPLDDAEVPLIADTGGQGMSPTFQMFDLDTAPKHFVEHAEFIMQSIAKSYGGQVVRRDGSNGRVVFDTNALTEIRNAQLPFAKSFEVDLWSKAVDMAKAHGHRLDPKLPPSDELEGLLTVHYPRLAKSYATPKEEREDLDWRLHRGLEHYGTIAQREHPEMSEHEAVEFIESNLSAQLPIQELQTRMNMSLGDPGDTVAQRFGAMGPLVRDAAQDDPSQDDDDLRERTD